jgi:hypothetical protein
MSLAKYSLWEQAARSLQACPHVATCHIVRRLRAANINTIERLIVLSLSIQM